MIGFILKEEDENQYPSCILSKPSRIKGSLPSSSKAALIIFNITRHLSVYSFILPFFQTTMEIMMRFEDLALPQSLKEEGGSSDPQQQSAYLSERGNKLKMQVSDLQAFKWRCQMTGVKAFPPSFQLIQVTTPPPNVSLSDLNHRNFAVLSFPVQSLVGYAQDILKAQPERQSLCEAFDLGGFVQAMAEKYRLNAYHNFSHAFSVQLMLYQLYNRSAKIRNCLTETQWFCTFLAALAHDLSHPGTNNSLQIKMNSTLAQEAGNSSVLEKYHLAEFWRIQRKNKASDFLAGINKDQARECKHLITRLIMATDVSRHNQGISTLRTINTESGILTGESALLVIEQLFHACDIGNPCLDFDNYINWGALVSYEFDRIGTKEKQLGFEMSPGMQHGSIAQFYTQQKGFCNYFVLPLWKELTVTFEEVGEYSSNIEKNIKRIEEYQLLQKA